MKIRQRTRNSRPVTIVGALIVLVVAAVVIVTRTQHHSEKPPWLQYSAIPQPDPFAGVTVAPFVRRGDYKRLAFGSPWDDKNDSEFGHNDCDTRDDILRRDLKNITVTNVFRCPNAVASGTLNDPYSGKTIMFHRGQSTSEKVQIDHIVPLSYAWAMGAYGWSDQERINFANDPLELLAVDGPTNNRKSNLPPGQWLPPNKAFRCSYAVQYGRITVKYHLAIDPLSARVVRYFSTQCPRLVS